MGPSDEPARTMEGVVSHTSLGNLQNHESIPLMPGNAGVRNRSAHSLFESVEREGKDTSSPMVLVCG